MKTFDLAEVRHFLQDFDNRMDLCDNGEGTECADLDASLSHYASLCHEFRNEVRLWGCEVFAGRVAFDPEVEKTFLEEGMRLYSRAEQMLAYGNQVEVPCFVLEGREKLQSALWKMGRLLFSWVSPGLSVGPAARRKPPARSAETVRELKRQIADLPKLPPTWQPAQEQQKKQFRQLQKRKKS